MASLAPDIILASQSFVRKKMLKDADIAFRVLASPFNEEAYKPSIHHLPPQEQARYLANGKAYAVGVQYPDAYVIGADQICALGNTIFDKPGTTERAIEHLQALQGQTHHQYSAACVYHQGQCVWHMVEIVRLHMRPLSDEEIHYYVSQDRPLKACGGYCYEKEGYTLFHHIEGSEPAIKGLPLDGLLAYLQQVHSVPA